MTNMNPRDTSRNSTRRRVWSLHRVSLFAATKLMAFDRMREACSLGIVIVKKLTLCFAVFAASFVLVGCSVVNPKQMSLDALAAEGQPLADVVALRGEPEFSFVDDGVEHIAYRVYTSRQAAELRCSVVYAVTDGLITQALAVGSSCHTKTREMIRVNTLKDTLLGKSMVEIIKTFGTPDRHQITEGSGEITYDLGSETAAGTGPVGDGSATLTLGVRIGCAMTLQIENGIVKSADASGGVCWATRF